MDGIWKTGRETFPCQLVIKLVLLIAAVPRRPRQDKSKTDKTAKRGRDFDLVRGSDSLEKPSRK